MVYLLYNGPRLICNGAHSGGSDGHRVKNTWQNLKGMGGETRVEDGLKRKEKNSTYGWLHINYSHATYKGEKTHLWLYCSFMGKSKDLRGGVGWVRW